MSTKNTVHLIIESLPIHVLSGNRELIYEKKIKKVRSETEKRAILSI
jgi:hypothetical protein